MDYKNYRVGYYPGAKSIGVIIFDDDMSKYNYTKAEDELKHIVNVFSIDGYQYEHYQNYLDENGLFMGIFPPEFIEASFQDYERVVQKEKKMRENRRIEQVKKPITEVKFEKMSINCFSLEEAINYINIVNDFNLENNGIVFPIEEYYKDILIKYWGNYKV